MMEFQPLVTWGAGLLLLLAACAPAASTSPANPPDSVQAANTIRIVTTTGMIADVVKNIGGQYVQVTQLMGAGVDPHLYTATENDVSTLMNADMILYNGLHLEARMTDIFEQIGQNKPVIAVGEAIPSDQVLKSQAGGEAPDPHIWMDVGLWALVAGKIRDELSRYDPDHTTDYKTNADNYLKQLDDLDRYARDRIMSIPQQQRALVTAHDAFHYFSRAYGIDVFAPQGITTAAEAGVEDIRRTIQVLVDRKVPAIFVESSVPPDVVEAIVAGAQAQGHAVEIGGQLFSDAMGNAGTPEGTYIGMIRHNVDTVVSALTGVAE